MAKKGETFFSPTMKSRMTFLVCTDETKGERIVVQFENEPDDIGPPYHLHPEQQEEYEVLEGELTLKVDGKEVVLRAGEKLLVPPNTPHCFWNASGKPVRFTSEHRPALGWERFITTIYDLDYDGKCNEKGLPRGLQLMTTLGHRNGEEYLVEVPRFAQRVLALLGRVLGPVTGTRPFYVSERRRQQA